MERLFIRVKDELTTFKNLKFRFFELIIIPFVKIYTSINADPEIAACPDGKDLIASWIAYFYDIIWFRSCEYTGTYRVRTFGNISKLARNSIYKRSCRRYRIAAHIEKTWAGTTRYILDKIGKTIAIRHYSKA